MAAPGRPCRATRGKYERRINKDELNWINQNVVELIKQQRALL